MALQDNKKISNAIKQSQSINEISIPLKIFNITFFNHIRIFNDKSRLSLSNRGDWLEHFNKQQYIKNAYFSKNPILLTQEYYLWDVMINPDNVMSVAKNDFNIAHGFTIVDKNKEYIDLFLFATTYDNHEINNFYINQLDVLKHFISYYKDKSRIIIKNCQPDQPTNVVSKNNQIPCEKDKINEFYLATALKKHYLNNDNSSFILSSREYECLSILVKGYSLKEASVMMDINQRTIYSYLENIKNKLNCSTKSEVLEIFRSL